MDEESKSKEIREEVRKKIIYCSLKKILRPKFKFFPISRLDLPRRHPSVLLLLPVQYCKHMRLDALHERLHARGALLGAMQSLRNGRFKEVWNRIEKVQIWRQSL